MREMVALSLLQQQGSAVERLRGVSFIQHIDAPSSTVLTALLDTLAHDPNPNVRLATIDALREFAGQEGVRTGLVQALRTQPSPLVQIALIDRPNGARYLVDLYRLASAAPRRPPATSAFAPSVGQVSG